MHKRETETQTGIEQLVALPNEIRFATWSDLASWGIRRVGTANKFTCTVDLPEGWRVRQSEHPHWQSLLDNRGRSRADIYLCGDFHGIRAFMAMRRRFTTSAEVEDNNKAIRIRVMDGDEPMFATEWVGCCIPKRDEFPSEFQDWQAYETAERLAKNWLARNFPYWQNCLQYWDCEF